MPLALIFPASLAFPKPPTLSLSSCRSFTGPDPFLPFSTVSSSLSASTDLNFLTSIRMGGGPRTYPGGVSKWQWKRMQAKKSKQLLKARLCRERQLYEMRKRAELKAAISELERPWEAVERAPVLFSSSADEQVKALADRFMRPSGFDMWTERDGPRLFRSPDDLLSSSRFIPKSVHRVQPYGGVSGEVADGAEHREKAMKYRCLTSPDSSSLESERSVHLKGGNRGSYCSDSELEVTGSTEAENNIAGQFDRHGRNRGFHGSDSGFAVDGLRMNGNDMERDFGSRSYRGLQSSLGPDSRMERREMAGNFGRRGGHRNSYGNHLQFAANGARIERDKISSDRNQGSYESHSEKTITGSRMQRHETGSRFDRGRGRGGRGGNRVSYRSYSELTVTDSKMEGEEIAGGFEKPIGRGVNRNSNYGSDSEIAVSDSRKGIVEKTGFRFRGRDYRNGGRVSLRPTTELALREGDDVRREKKRSVGRNGGFMVSRGRRKPFRDERIANC